VTKHRRAIGLFWKSSFRRSCRSPPPFSPGRRSAILLLVAYDIELADRIREILAGEPEVTEKRMFGGLAFLVQGRLVAAAGSKGDLLLRVDPVQSEGLIADPRARRYVMRGREMAGWLGVEVDESMPDSELERWVQHGLDYADTLEPR
jgi:TfoX/Sxy family transcriptional regulator of competence genes